MDKLDRVGRRLVTVDAPHLNQARSFMLPAGLGLEIIDRNLNMPPGSPARDDVYIVGASPNDAWVGYADHLAVWDEGWFFVRPWRSMTVWMIDEAVPLIWNGSAWRTITTTA